MPEQPVGATVLTTIPVRPVLVLLEFEGHERRWMAAYECDVANQPPLRVYVSEHTQAHALDALADFVPPAP